MNPEQVELLVNTNKVLITDANRLRRCVDGRYENIDNMPMAATPGGDAGYVMAIHGAQNILQLDVPPQLAIDTVVETNGGADKFQFHTDSKHPEVGTGCGHLTKAQEDPQSYGLKQEQIDFLFEQLPKLLESGAHQEVLQGDHAETVVIVVDSSQYGLKPLLRTDDGILEAFVFQPTLNESFLDKLTKVLQQKLAGAGIAQEEHVLRKAIGDAFDKQLAATLKKLAPDLRVDHVQIDEHGLVKTQAAAT